MGVFTRHAVIGDVCKRLELKLEFERGVKEGQRKESLKQGTIIRRHVD